MEFDHFIANVDPAAKRRLGEMFARFATQLIGDADRADDAQAALEARQERTAAVRRAARQVTALMLESVPRDAAIERVAALHHIEPARIFAWWRADEGDRAVRALRDIEIVRHARRGWTDAEIGRKFALHPKSVGRIIAREVRRRRAPAATP